MICHSWKDLTGDHESLKSLCKHIMNKCASRRLISKQEAMVLLADLPLTDCTETIETLSINNSNPLRRSNENKTDNRLPTKYAKRPRDKEHESMSLYDYCVKIKNTDSARRRRKNCKFLIPNFVGASGTPTFPVTESYARHTIIVHKPWREYPKNIDWIGEFEKFIHDKENCPKVARLQYDRVMTRYYDGMCHYEPKTTMVDHSGNPISEDDFEMLTLLGLPDSDDPKADLSLLESLDRGIEFKWDTKPKVRLNLVISKSSKYSHQKQTETVVLFLTHVFELSIFPRFEKSSKEKNTSNPRNGCISK